jgi:metal-dependent HD superfamily phosphatase/phosphodiesterase
MNKSIESATFTVPARHNPRLQALVERINHDDELRQMWRCANVNAVERLGMSDHGEVHIRIVANAALRLLRLLRETGHPAGIQAQHHLAAEDAEVVVVLAAALHDLGIITHYDHHPEHSLPLAFVKAKELLAGLYPVREQTVVVAETLHAIATHHGAGRCLTLEAGVLRLADALDMTAGRIRPVSASSSVPAAPGELIVDEVQIKKGEARPVRVEIKIRRPVGLHQMEDSLRRKLQGSPLFGLVEIISCIDDEERAIPLYEMEAA